MEEEFEKQLRKVAGYCSCLASLERLKILMRLSRNDEGSTVEELKTETGMEQNVLSYHMKKLVRSGLAKEERRGRFKIYFLQSDADAFVSMTSKLAVSVL
jgi:DNA-binding transcriptional ArsR family regulator